MNRTVEKTVKGVATSDGAGVSLTRIIGQQTLPRLDPFLMLDLFGSDKPDDYIAGFPPHPHRGFQTVTYMLNGAMRHRDSKGNDGVIRDGGIQWMNAGRGIIHEEMPEQKDGLLKGFQLWVNLPAQEKMSEPKYQDIEPDLVPEVKKDNASVKVLAGQYEGAVGPVEGIPVNPLFIDVSFQPDAESPSLEIPISQGHSAFVFCYEGQISVGDEVIGHETLAVLGNGESVRFTGDSAAKFIVVAGMPINEPVVQYGPFVMNTEQEIQQALWDYQSGRLA